MLAMALGNPTTIHVKMISDMPLPMPRSLICSPSHMMKAVPVVREMMVRKTKPMPGWITMPCCIACKPCAMPNDCRTERMMVRERVHWVILRRPSSPSFCNFSSVGTTTVNNCRMIDAVMYGMIPNAKTVSRRMLPPANRSKNPKIDPELELKNSSQRVMLMPGVGMWPPSRYTASMASANSSRLRRSGTRNMFVNASNSLFMTPFDFHRYSVLAPSTCAVPPDAWIFSSADLENWWASTVILRVNTPVPRIFRPSWTLWITPEASRLSTLNVSPSSFSNWPRLTMANCFLKMLVNPRFGSRRCNGIWPPSKPRFWLNPVPARWPLEPRVEVLPCPEPMPRPIRFRPFTWPAGGFNPLRFIVPILHHQRYAIAGTHYSPRRKAVVRPAKGLLDHLQQVRNFLDHAAEDRRVRTLDHLVQLAQTQALHHAFLLLGNRVRAAVKFNLNLAFHLGSPFTTYRRPGRACRPPWPGRAAIPAPRWSPSPRCAGCAVRWTWSARWSRRTP